MRKRIILSLLAILSFALSGVAQIDSSKIYVDQGVQLHDAGKYDAAIGKYRQALKIDPNSPVANYEISFSFFSKEDYENALIYSRRVIVLNKGSQLQAYVVCGSSLDMLGKSAEAITTFQEGIRKYPGFYLLYYNLALTAYKTGDLETAEKSAINAIAFKSSHAGSHYVLANICFRKRERVKSILALYYYLLLEPNASRSMVAYKLLQEELNTGIVKEPKNTISVVVPESKDTTFFAVETVISLMSASRNLESKKKESDLDFFVRQSSSIFELLGTKHPGPGIWNDLYVHFFSELQKSGNTKAFCHYISQSCYPTSVEEWIQTNKPEFDRFKGWVKNK